VSFARDTAIVSVAVVFLRRKPALRVHPPSHRERLPILSLKDGL